MVIKQNRNLKKLKNFGSADVSFSLVNQPTSSIEGTTNGAEEVEHDAVYLTSQDASVTTTASISTSPPVECKLTSSDESILTVDDLGKVSWIQDGTANVFADNGKVKVKTSVTVTKSVEGFSRIFERYDDNTVGKDVSDWMATRAAVSSDTLMFDGQNWNSNFFAYDQRSILSCIARTNSRAGTNYTGRARTLITPRHIIGTEHLNYQLFIGDTITFTTSNNTQITKTITGKAVNTWDSGAGLDIVVYTLDSDVSGITPAKILPENFFSYKERGISEYVTFAGFMPVLSLHKDDRIGVQYFPTNETIFGREIIFTHDGSTNDYESFEKNATNGTSGNPIFFVLNGELILLTTFTGGGAGSGTNYGRADNKNEINTLISAADANAGVSTGYTLSAVDLSIFD